jgi:NAD(P)H-hydrate repair Nnr-like enzyme with NAD(P)H-hydrate epimerase domain
VPGLLATALRRGSPAARLMASAGSDALRCHPAEVPTVRPSGSVCRVVGAGNRERGEALIASDRAKPQSRALCRGAHMGDAGRALK